METLSSNETTWATTITNIIYVGANVMNIYAKFQLQPPLRLLRRRFLNIFFENLSFYGNQSKSAIWTKFIRLVEDYSRNISVKTSCQKYLQLDSSKCQFSFFPIINKWQI